MLASKPELGTMLMTSAEIDMSSPKVLDRHPNRRRRSPIMVEFADPETTMVDIQRAMEAGMNIAKFKMAFSTKEEKIAILDRVYKAAARCAEKMGVDEWPVATCATLKTLMVKTGVFADESNNKVETGSEVILSNDRKLIQHCQSDRIFIDYAHMKDIKVGMEISLDQAEVVLICVTEIDDTSIKCKVTKGGTLKDLRPVDVLVVYYARDGPMIKKIKKYMSQATYKPIILSAICNQQGLDHIDDILKIGKPLFLAGAVFKHALEVGRFNDHELADVSNALLDGPKLPVNAAEAAAISCVAVANQTKARIIIIPTVSGRTPRVLLWLQPTCIVITVSTMQNVTRRLFTCRNIVPLVYKSNVKLQSGKKLDKVMERRVRYAAEFAVMKGWLVYGDIYISLQRSSEGNPFCDMVRIWSVDFLKKLLIECDYAEDQFLPPKKPSEVIETECQLLKDEQEKQDSKVQEDSQKAPEEVSEKATQVKEVTTEVEVKVVKPKPSQIKEEETTPTETKKEEITPTDIKQEEDTPSEKKQGEIPPTEIKEEELLPTEAKQDETTPAELEASET
ncbi:uncharacterized protein LOC126369815 [Pectinophora gossypiella]|uniref:uncharacterized protein LOC126369815 n=1 Tax=Pectinophora gossypiella TaxID=13191 RepID=UPI00214E2B73|nr:uncharacterized protein LOC126369815 [Pectinophora gossypiella]